MSPASARPPARLLRVHPRPVCCYYSNWGARLYSGSLPRPALAGFKSSFKVEQKTLIPNTPVVTRFAPSPTGYLHLGSLRTALYNYLLAKRTSGTFILRVEDTDRARTVADAEQRLYEDLDWAGIHWDEGPDKGGDRGPYRQSDRVEIYQQHADHLVHEGKAYRCFCSAKNLDDTRLEALDTGGAARYPGTCRTVSRDEADERAARGEQHVIRFKTNHSLPRPSFVDLTYGRFQKREDEDDFILIKSDGFPTYHFANVVDDHLMDITHVIRGAEWLISTTKHIALYDAFGWHPPEYAHAPLLSNKDGSKLSKRDHSIGISTFRDNVVLPAAVNNWAALAGCQMRKGNSEIFPTMEELVENFSLKFTKGNVHLTPGKMKKMHHAAVKALLHNDRVAAAQTFFKPQYERILQLDSARKTGNGPQIYIDKSKTLPLNTEILGDLVPAFRGEDTAIEYLGRFWELEEYSYADGVAFISDRWYLIWQVPQHRQLEALQSLSTDGAQPIDIKVSDTIIEKVILNLKQLPDWTPEQLDTILSNQALETSGLGVKTIWTVLRAALVGDVTIPIMAGRNLIFLLGRDETLRRFGGAKSALEHVG